MTRPKTCPQHFSLTNWYEININLLLISKSHILHYAVLSPMPIEVFATDPLSFAFSMHDHPHTLTFKDDDASIHYNKLAKQWRIKLEWLLNSLYINSIDNTWKMVKDLLTTTTNQGTMKRWYILLKLYGTKSSSTNCKTSFQICVTECKKWF